jgi:hypothetical protein
MEKNKKITAYSNQNAATNAVSHRVFQQNMLKQDLQNLDWDW